MKKLYIIDGSGYLFRAYFGLPEMVGPEGVNVNAIFGFMKMVLKLFEDQPDYFVLAWDAPHKTIRHEMFTDYKANRPSIPDDFRQQIQLTKDLIASVGVPFLEIPGYEADDLIASVAKQAETDPNIHTFVFSSDKDLKQLLSPTLTFKDPMKNIETKPTDFVREYGFECQYILDYLALVGDASDNIPGVRGIGAKGAQKLIEKYHTIETIYDHIDEITGSTRVKLLDGKESAFRSKKLIELIDVPGVIDASISDNYAYTLDFPKIEKECLEHYSFNSMKKLIDGLKKDTQTPQMVSLFG